ncbi:hypothetical protein LCGC14_2298900, partial [marine sediment metagenome]
FADVWTYLGEKIDPADSATFAVNADNGISLYGTGVTPTGGGAIAIAGSLNRKTFVARGQGAIAAAGSPNRKISVIRGAGAVAMAGALVKLVKLAMGQGAVGIAGSVELDYLLGVQVGEEAVLIKKASIFVDQRIEERSVARFTIVDIPGTASYSKGQLVKIYDPNNDLIFGGVIDNPETVRPAPSGELLHPITCADYHYTADKRLVAESYLATSAGDIVTDLRTKYLLDEGVTVGNIEAGPDIVQAVFNYVRTSQALDRLAELAGFTWFIDENKALYFQARTTTAAPWALVDTNNDVIKGTSRFSGANPMYRNRQYIRGGRDVTGAQTETFTADGDMVAFTVGYGINAVPTVKEDGGAAKDMGIKGIDTAKEYYWSKGDPIVVAENAPANGVVVTIEYVGQYDVLVLATDEAAITALAAIEGSGTGWVDAIDDEPKLDDSDAALDVAKAKLSRFAVDAARLNYDTVRTGLRPGQVQAVTLPAYGLAAEDMLIESVRTHIYTGNLMHRIQAIQGPGEGSWAQFFLKLASGKDEVMEKLNVGSDQILILLIQREATWGWGETVTPVVLTCTPVNGTVVG